MSATAECCCSPCAPPCLQLLGCLTLFMTANLLKVLFAKVRLLLSPATPCPLSLMVGQVFAQPMHAQQAYSRALQPQHVHSTHASQPTAAHRCR